MHERHALLRAHGWAGTTHLALPVQDLPLPPEPEGNEDAPPARGSFVSGERRRTTQRLELFTRRLSDARIQEKPRTFRKPHSRKASGGFDGVRVRIPAERVRRTR